MDPGDEDDRILSMVFISATGEQRQEWTAASPRVLRIAKGIHVVPGPARGWEVRTLGPDRIRTWFSTCSEALSYALERQRDFRVDVIVHHQSQGSRRIKILEAEAPPESRDD